MNWRQFANKNEDWLMVKQNNKEISFMDTRDTFEDIWILSVSKDKFSIGDLRQVNTEKQHEIIDFINQGPEKWFEEPLFYIILGRGTGSGQLTAYQKVITGHYEINDQADIHGDNETDFVFTQEEIDRLKSKLPDNMQKIVDLGKTEVKD